MSLAVERYGFVEGGYVTRAAVLLLVAAATAPRPAARWAYFGVGALWSAAEGILVASGARAGPVVVSSPPPPPRNLMFDKLKDQAGDLAKNLASNDSVKEKAEEIIDQAADKASELAPDALKDAASGAAEKAADAAKTALGGLKDTMGS